MNKIIPALQNNRIAVNLMFFINGFMFSNWAGRIPKLQTNYELDNGLLGLVLLSSSLGALIAMPFTGWMISLLGSKKITIISSIAFLLAVPAFTLAPNVGVLMVMFFFMGIATGTMDIAMNAQAVFVEEKYTRPIMSFFHGIFSAGMMVGAGVSALYSLFDISLTGHFSSLLFLLIPPLVWSARRLIDDAPLHEEVTGKKFFHWPDKSLISIGLIAFCCMLGEGAMSDWSANYMKQVVQANKALIPIGLFSFSLAMMIGRFFGDQARMKIGDQKLIQLEGLLALIGISMIIFLPYTITALFGFFLVGLGLATIVPIAYSISGRIPGLSPGVGISMVTTIGYSGFLFGPAIIGFLADLLGLRYAMFFVFGLFVLMVALAIFTSGISNNAKVE